MIRDLIKKYKNALSILFSILMLVLILRLVGFNEMLNAIRAIDRENLTLALLLYAASLLVATLRWDRIIDVTEYNSRFKTLLQYSLIDKFANSFFPTSAVGMALRSYLLNKDYEMPKSVGLATIVLDYGVDIFGTFMLSVPFFFIIRSELSESLMHTFRTSLLTIGIVSFIVFVISYSEHVFVRTKYDKKINLRERSRLFSKISELGISKKFIEFSETFSLILERPIIFSNALFLTFFKVMLDAIRISILFEAFGVSVPFYYFILFDSTWTFLAPLMFTPGGVGVIETGRIALYSLIPNVSVGVITPVVFIDRLITYWLTVFIGAVLFFHKGIDISSLGGKGISGADVKQT
ncbi:MAG TPA: lysylphosphatidylglycerol synthase transmembrane domain-containing protein [Candidatus Methanofastidiosa archaeon]|nr:lysylphosphatidylglycerol synthase transmembrane domain-containing protein [Candidatus Methanofastidiosa archaeon]